MRLNQTRIAMLGCVLTIVLAFVSVAWTAATQPEPPPSLRVLPDTPEEIAFWEEQDRIKEGGQNYKPLKFLCDTPGVNQPPLRELNELELPEATPVVGICVNGKACAFVLNEIRTMDQHVVNTIIDSTSISVTYCDLVDCVRVVKKDSESLIPLRVGGLDVNKQLVLLLNGVRYGQESPALPLKDHPFSRTSLGEWKDQHPATRVYVRPERSPRDPSISVQDI